MSVAPTIALVINTSNQPEYLARVLAAVSHQADVPEEVLLADDGSGEETRQVFARWQKNSTARAFHAWQEHQGFRRSRILNLAIAAARADYLVFLDGDTVPHPAFIADHRRLARLNTFVQGHRALIGQRAARAFGTNAFHADRRAALLAFDISGLKHAFRWPKPQDRVRSDLKGVRGCNLAIWRADLEQVNGYNEAFEGWGREDSELAVRLLNSEVTRRDVRGWALCYHLWHPPASRSQLAANDDLLERAQRENARRCEKGLNLHKPSPSEAQSA
jgi:glycosyltransferase involved in cell wall biosynthesis